MRAGNRNASPAVPPAVQQLALVTAAREMLAELAQPTRVFKSKTLNQLQTRLATLVGGLGVAAQQDRRCGGLRV